MMVPSENRPSQGSNYDKAVIAPNSLNAHSQHHGSRRIILKSTGTRRQCRILVVEQQAKFGHSWNQALLKAGYQSLWIDTLDLLWHQVDNAPQSLLLINMALASPNDFSIVQALRQSQPCLILLTFSADPQKRAVGFNAGANGILPASDASVVVAHVQALLRC